MEHYHLRVAKDLVFSAAHFITLEGGVCEPLHGHNYRVAAEVHGPLGENHYVVDFLRLQSILRGLISTLDHRVLLPLEHPCIRVTASAEEVEVRYAERRWVFPRSDCVLLPVANTTGEMLARHLARALHETLTGAGLPFAFVRMEVEEMPGFVAVCEWGQA